MHRGMIGLGGGMGDRWMARSKDSQIGRVAEGDRQGVVPWFLHADVCDDHGERREGGQGSVRGLCHGVQKGRLVQQ